MDALTPGILLISDPFMKDPNFTRTVVLLCEHREEGSFGFVLNKSLSLVLNQVIPEAEGLPLPLFSGGPVQKDSLHFLHQRPDLLPGGLEVFDGVYWGGDFEEVLAGLRSDALKKEEIRFYIGYSGWGVGQLEEELNQKSWITRPASRQLVFHKHQDRIWSDALKDLGGEYQQMVHYPIDPQLN